MASTKFYITSGLPPNDTADDGSTKVYVTSGLIPDDSGSIPSGALDYAITANETITVTIPASALTDTTVATEASSTFTITADSTGWEHKINLIAPANVHEINGVSFSNINSVNGVE